MSAPPAPLRLVEVSGAEALWLLEGSVLGRLLCTRWDQTAIVRAGETASRRTLSGWTHGPRDTLLRLRPETAAGFRPSRGEA